MSRVIDFFSGWEQHNAMLVRTLTPLTDEQLSWTPRDDFWSIRVLACHIAAVRAAWFKGWMGEGDEEFERLITIDDEEIERPTRDAKTICAALDESWRYVRPCLERWTEDDLDARFQRPRPNAQGERPWRDRRYIVWHVAEHDVHHGGEISLILGIHGHPGFQL